MARTGVPLVKSHLVWGPKSYLQRRPLTGHGGGIRVLWAASSGFNCADARDETTAIEGNRERETERQRDQRQLYFSFNRHKLCQVELSRVEFDCLFPSLGVPIMPWAESLPLLHFTAPQRIITPPSMTDRTNPQAPTSGMLHL